MIRKANTSAARAWATKTLPVKPEGVSSITVTTRLGRVVHLSNGVDCPVKPGNDGDVRLGQTAHRQGGAYA